ncbi:hypothetical protein [Nocardiopsis sp. LOL_012]|uniref:hypothetical protein n=1 Tax=Nocardiopsis sp. LOL_012 TaxID=3345409 RepID=UPI003A8B90A8
MQRRRMPGCDHEFKVRLFHHHPELAPALLRDVIGEPLPDHVRAELGCIDRNRGGAVSAFYSSSAIERVSHAGACCSQ